MTVHDFIPALWAPALLEQLKTSVVMWTGEPFIGPQPKPVLYRPVEYSGLAEVIDSELYWNVVPDHERAEAIQVMIDALNEWIERKVSA
jgi:hypothetical protein